MNHIVVTVIRNNCVCEQFLFFGEEITERAERKFLELCAENDEDWDDYDFVDIEKIIEDGCIKLPSGSVVLNWPTLEGDSE